MERLSEDYCSFVQVAELGVGMPCMCYVTYLGRQPRRMHMIGSRGYE